MMKTRRRVKRTVREMPRRLTIRLSKGSNRNMVEDPGKANALLSPRTKHGRQMVLSDSTPLRKEASSQQKINSIPKFTSFDSLNRKPGSKMIKRATGGNPKTSDLPGIDGLWR